MQTVFVLTHSEKTVSKVVLFSMRFKEYSRYSRYAILIFASGRTTSLRFIDRVHLHKEELKKRNLFSAAKRTEIKTSL